MKKKPVHSSLDTSSFPLLRERFAMPGARPPIAASAANSQTDARSENGAAGEAEELSLIELALGDD
ncbi:MAG: hypothetical protein ACRED2_13180, partial [Methylocella sp.]